MTSALLLTTTGQSKQRGPFTSPPAPSPGAFAPSGAAWDVAEAVVNSLGVTTYFYKATADSLRVSGNAEDGVTASDPVGFANDYFSPGTASRALVAEGSQRMVFGTVAGITSISSVGDASIQENQRGAFPVIDSSTATIILVARMTDNTSANQTLLEIQPLRIQSQFTGRTGPCVRDGASTFYDFGLSSMLNRWTVLVVQFNRGSGQLRTWYDGASSWTTSTVTSWANNPDGSWPDLAVSLLSRNSFMSTNGAPAAAAYHALGIVNTSAITTAQLQTIINLAVEGTDITATLPADPDPGDPGDPDLGGTMPTPLSVVDVTTSEGLATAITGAAAGRRIRLANGTYTLPANINVNGTEANPIVISAANKLGATINGGCTINGNHVWFWGLQFQGTWTFNGTNNRVLRCRGILGGGADWIVARACQDMVVAYCEWPSRPAGKRWTVDAQPRNGCRDLTVLNCLVKAWGGAATVPMRSGGTIADTNNITGGGLFKNLLFDGAGTVGGDASEFALEVKGSGCTYDRVTVKNISNNSKGTIAIRHGLGNKVLNCLTKSGRGFMFFHGRNASPHEIYNCRAEGAGFFRVMAGTFNGENTLTGDGADNYPNSNNILVSDCNGPITVGWMYTQQSPPAFNAVNPRLRRHTGAVTSSFVTGLTTTGTTPYPVPNVGPVEVTEAEVGPDAGTDWDYDSQPTVAAMIANPFRAASAHHTPLGSNATYGDDNHAIRQAWASVIPANNGQVGGGAVGTINQGGSNFGLLETTTSAAAPLRTLRRRNCTDTATPTDAWELEANEVQRRIPDSTAWPLDDPNPCREHHHALFRHDDYKVEEFFQATGTAARVYRGSINRVNDTRGYGHGLTLGDVRGTTATGASILFGALRVEELFGPDPIGHALKIAIPGLASYGQTVLLSRSIVYPAVRADGFANQSANNTGPIPYGQRMAILPNVDLDSFAFETAEGRKIGKAMQGYGVVVLDDANGHILRCNGSLGANAAAIIRDYRKCLRLLYPVTNAVTGATASVAIGGSASGNIGTPGAAFTGTLLAPNTGLVA